MSTKPCLAVFGGSFDPPHISHVLVPSLVLAQGLAHSVLVVPCWRHPLAKVLTDYSLRMRWVMAAMAEHGQKVEVSDIEQEMIESRACANSLTEQTNPQSDHDFVATIDLLDEVAKRNRDKRVRLLIGSDIVHSSETSRWTRWNEICARFTPIVIPRAGYGATLRFELPQVSSSEIRESWRRPDWLSTKEIAAKLPIAVRNMLASQQDDAPCVWLVGRGRASRHLQIWLEERGFRALILRARDMIAGHCLRPDGPNPQGVWLLVPESELFACAQALVKSDWIEPPCPVVHASGAVLARQGLQPLVNRGHPVATIHPICSLCTDLRFSMIRECAFGVEGDELAREWAHSLIFPQSAIDLQRLDADSRFIYHAACALLANHLAVPYESSTRSMKEIGLNPDSIERALGILGTSAWQNLQRLGIPDGVSGPMVRGDDQSVQRHIDVLPGKDSELYRFLADRLREVLRNSSIKSS